MDFDKYEELSAEKIAQGLSTRLIGKNMVCFDCTDSTNEQAKHMGREGCPNGTVVLAEEQTGGKGRLSRRFFSPRGKGLWFSVVLRPEFLLPQDAPRCTLMAAAAMAMAMERFGLRAGIKWPNDILYQGKKLTGILTEMSARVQAIDFIVIGIGINVNFSAEDFPEELREIATSLSIMKGEKISRIAFLQAVLESMEELYLSVEAQGFAPVMEKWKKYAVTLGQEVHVLGVGAHESFDGIAVDLDADGALLVDTEDGRKRVVAGDVSIRSKVR